MTYKQRGRGVRPAFTLIELLVVIAIIAILVSLTAAAVMRALGGGQKAKDRSEISELETKLAGVRSQYPGVVYLPSMLHLSKTNNYNLNSQLDKDSIAYLTQRFGRHTCFNIPSAPPAGMFIDWNGDGNANEELFLEGEQCLVFHLGGVPKTVNGVTTMTGFSTVNALNPAQAVQTQGETRQGPYFEFQSARLQMIASSIPGNTAGAKFPVYQDAWSTGQPFAYFTSYNTEGGGLYNKYLGSVGVGDCQSLGTAPGALKPYIQSTASGIVNFANPGTFQIISAGKDGKFGAGGTNWNPASGTTDANGKDDQANFSPNLLGVAAN